MGWIPHVTVAAVIKKENKYLLVKETINNKIVINQPAGHLEKDETLLDAVIREVHEETGGHFEPAGIVGIYHYLNCAENITYIRFCFHGNCASFDVNPNLDNTIIQTLWLTKEEIASFSSILRSPLVTICVQDFESSTLYPLDVIKY